MNVDDEEDLERKWTRWIRNTPMTIQQDKLDAAWKHWIRSHEIRHVSPMNVSSHEDTRFDARKIIGSRLDNIKKDVNIAHSKWNALLLKYKNE